MNILILASHIGTTAPGVVYQSLIQEIAKHHSVSIVAPVISNTFDTSNLKILPCLESPFKSPKAEVLQFKLFGRQITDDIWVKRQQKKIEFKDIKDVDLIISMISSHHYIAAILGAKIASKYNKKWGIYSVDAIPAPLNWFGDKLYHKRCQEFIVKYINKANVFFSSNPQMLAYMLEPLKDVNITTGVIYTPIREFLNIQHLKDYSNINFLYTGNIYGPRRKKAVLDGFMIFLQKHPSATFTFVGHYHDTTFSGYEALISQGSLIIKDYTTDLQPLYESASVLVDINAYFDNDVFLSSKIINYLPIKRPIISVTGGNSPSRNLFTNDPSIIHCYHTPEDVANAMEDAVTMNNCNFNNRDEYIKRLNAETVLTDFYKYISSN